MDRGQPGSTTKSGTRDQRVEDEGFELLIGLFLIERLMPFSATARAFPSSPRRCRFSPQFPPLRVILLSSIDVILSFSPCRGSACRLCATWQRIFWPDVACGVLSRSLRSFSGRSGRSASLEQSGVASRQLFQQQRPPLRRQPRRSVLQCYQPWLRRQHQRSVSG